MSELGKLMWIARIARPGAICDASESAQTFPTEETIEFLEEEEFCPKNEEKEIPTEEEEDFEHMPGFADFKSWRRDENKANLPKKNKKIDTSKTHFTVRSLVFLRKAM